MARKTLFVTGIDTGVGKTLVTAALLYAARQAGLRTLALKPVASGCEVTDEGLRNEDALILQQAVTEPLSYPEINPIALEEAIAPHVAARKAGVRLGVSRLTGFCRGVMSKPGDLCLVEGAGGWRVPLNSHETYAGLAQELQLPVVLVVALRLGCINHALLTAEAIRRDGLQLAGWVANRVDREPMTAEADTLEYLKNALGAPCLGDLPRLDEPDPQALSQHLDPRAVNVLVEK